MISSRFAPTRPAGVRVTRARTAAALVSLALGGVALGTAEFASMGVLPVVAAAFRVSQPAAGVLISAYALGVVIGAPLLAVLGARWSRRSLLVVTMGLFTVANMCSLLAPSFPALAATRFVAGLPHGAYLGAATLAAASLVPAERRGRAIATVILGLTVANVAGVPVSTAIGQYWGWRAAFAVVSVLGVLTIVAVGCVVPPMPGTPAGAISRELGALRSGRLWTVIAICVVGCGGMFAVYTYLSSTLTEVSGISRGWVPAVLGLFGVGMSIGTWLGGRLADWSRVHTIRFGLAAVAVVMAGFTVLVRGPVTALVGVFLVGLICLAMMPSMQTWLMDTVPQAPTLASSILHSATNSANALGAWAGGVVLSTGAGYAAIGWVGAAMAVAGLVVLALARLLTPPARTIDTRHDQQRRRPTCPMTPSGRSTCT